MSEAIGVNELAEGAGRYRCTKCGAEKRVRAGRRPGPCGACRASGVKWEKLSPATYRPAGSAVEHRATPAKTETRRPEGSARDEAPTPEGISAQFKRTGLWRPGRSGRRRVRDETGDGESAKRGPVFVEEEAEE
jgi:hypothetical protein